jgi:DNA replication and repair protein RecF
LDKTYLDNLIQYNQVLRQRNGLLRLYGERSSAMDWVAMESYDQMLAPLGTSIFDARSKFIEEFLPVFQKYYQFLVEDAEHATIHYSSEVPARDYISALLSSRSRDISLQRTSFGIHKDDFEFFLQKESLKKYGSQGQRKSFVIAMKLAQFEIVGAHKGFRPILLLDDIFDKLDDFRIARLLELIKSEVEQLFISDARPERTMSLLKQVDVPSTIFAIDQGKVNLYEYQEE